jgi:tetratricopeptide (TPR) repeat protein
MTGTIRHRKIGWLLGVFTLVCLCFWAGCGGSRQVRPETAEGDREFDRSSRMARVAFDNGQIPQAIAGYQRALGRAYLADDLKAIVDTLYNLAVCHLRQGNYRESMVHAEKAEFEWTAAGHSVPADLLLVQALALYHLGFPDRSRQISADILSIRPAASPETLSRTHFLRGILAADQGDADLLQLAITALGEPFLPALQADRLELIGRLALLDGRWDDAAAAFDQTAGLRSANRNYRLMATALANAGHSCERANRLEDAAYRYLRAARSSALSGDTTRADVWIQESMRLAEKSGALSLLQAARQLQRMAVDESKPQ